MCCGKTRVYPLPRLRRAEGIARSLEAELLDCLRLDHSRALPWRLGCDSVGSHGRFRPRLDVHGKSVLGRDLRGPVGGHRVGTASQAGRHGIGAPIIRRGARDGFDSDLADQGGGNGIRAPNRMGKSRIHAFVGSGMVRLARAGYVDTRRRRPKSVSRWMIPDPAATWQERHLKSLGATLSWQTSGCW